MKPSRYNVVFDADDAVVAYNLRSGSFLEFGLGQRDSLEVALAVAAPPAARPEVHDVLAEHGFLVGDDVDEVALLEARNEEWKVAGNLMLTIALTQACNFDCGYCFEAHLAKSRMRREVVERIVRFVERRTRGAKQLNLDWYGGEPLLAYDLLFEMDQRIGAICRANGCAYESSISTNGALLTAERSRQLGTQTSVRSVRVCLDGPPEIHDKYRPFAGGHGSFAIIWKNLQDALPHLKVKVRLNVDRGNEDQVPVLLDMVHQDLNHPNTIVAIKPIISSRLRPNDNAYTPEQWSAVEPRLKGLVLDHGLALDGKGEQSCAHCAVFSDDQYMVDPKGLLYKCSDSFAPEEAVGRILEDGSAELDKERVDPWVEFPTFYDEQCRACSALPLCMGGCTFRRIAFGKNWCGAERYNVEQYARLRHRVARAGGRTVAVAERAG